MNRRAIVTGTAVAAIAVFAGGAAYYSGNAEDQAAAALEEANLVRAYSPVIGPADAPVTIVEFFDPSCEACRTFYPIVKQVMETFPEKTRLVIRYAPLHEGSDEAIRILEAARIQDVYIQVLEKLLFEQPQWAVHGAPDLDKAWSFAAEAGLNVESARDPHIQAKITLNLDLDIADMKEVGLRSTPTFFVNGKPLPSFGSQQLHDLVAAEVKAADGARTQSQ